ncbi:hypothetical protein Taro_005625 [Colocasia esculenta]|uniref:Uncharacterized protein n=1 Tax=Colocasia esculenta TaxID=4460 RepID=A0A843TTN5_COLES|nr:hypothetical protein [Colocasia esculenta]
MEVKLREVDLPLTGVDTTVTESFFLWTGVDLSGTNFYRKGSVDTPHTGVDTMLQALSQKMKKWSTSVDTSPSQVDTRDSSQRNMSTSFYIRSTPDAIKWKQSIEKTSRKIPKIRVQSIG